MAAWRTSSHSKSTNCVQAAWSRPSPAGPGMVAVRDSKDPGGPVLTFTVTEWAAFTAALRAA